MEHRVNLTSLWRITLVILPILALIGVGIQVSTIYSKAAAEGCLVPGTLDPTFNGTGFVTTPGNGFFTALQTDGKIVAVGYTGFNLRRYNSDGSVDTSFNISSSSATPQMTVNAVGLQHDGKIVLAGSTTSGTIRNIAVARFNSSGLLDTSFNGTGRVTTSINNQEYANGISIQSDGKILVAGGVSNAGASDFAVVRYNANGTLDMSFDGDGISTIPLAGTSEGASDIAVQTDGKIVLAGTRNLSAFIVARLMATGSLDTSFGGSGIATTSFDPIGPSMANAIALQNDGKIVVAGYGHRPNSAFGDFALVRWNTDGSLDTSFDDDGKVTTNVGPDLDRATALAIQQDGKIVAAGYHAAANQNTAVVRYNSDGRLDTSFANSGIFNSIFVLGDDAAWSVDIQPDGNIVIGGYANTGNPPFPSNFMIARLIGRPCEATPTPTPTPSPSATPTPTPVPTPFEIFSIQATGRGNESQSASIKVGRSFVNFQTLPMTTSTVRVSAEAGFGNPVRGSTCSAGVDYVFEPQTLTFGPGVTQQTVTVALCGDVSADTDELLLRLSNPSAGATISSANGAISLSVVTINDTANQFKNPSSISILNGSPGGLYPSPIVVSGATNNTFRIRVTLYDLYTTLPDNLDVLLVGPNGAKYALVGDIGGTTAITESGAVTLTFADYPNAVLPDAGRLFTGIFKPTTCETPVTNFPAPAPVGPYVEPGCVVARTNAQSLYGNFAGVTANGTWNLYVRDDGGVARPDEQDFLRGEVKGGWGIELLPSTSSGIDISGRVLAPDGRGLRNATVTITDGQGNRRTATTGSFGYYKFFDVEAGSSVVMEVRSNRYRFASRLVQVVDTLSDVDFAGID